MGILKEHDMEAFAGYGQAYARWREAEEFLSQHGTIFKTPSGYVQQVPQVSIAQQNLKIMQSFCSEFGLTPASRARLYAGSGEKADTDDPMENILKGGWKDVL
jgi:P27 family predicted phage terminase small subunit